MSFIIYKASRMKLLITESQIRAGTIVQSYLSRLFNHKCDKSAKYSTFLLP